MPVSRIVYEEIPVGTVLREGTAEHPVLHVVASIEPREPDATMPGFPLPRWKIGFRAPTEEETILCCVMQT